MGRPAIVTPEPVALPERELLARVFRTLGDPTRIRLLEALDELGEASQSELVARVKASQSRASEHLACLHWCGFVDAERRGRTVRYRLADGHASDLLRLARTFMRENDRAVGQCESLPED